MRVRHLIHLLIWISLTVVFAYGIITEHLYSLGVIDFHFVGNLTTAKSAVLWVMWGCFFLSIFMTIIQFTSIFVDSISEAKTK